MTESSALTILFLAANPIGSSQSRLEQEARDISDGLLRARHRDRFQFQQRWAVRPRDIQLALLECNPQIVHFAGNRQQDKILEQKGTIAETEIEPEEGLVFEDDTGHIHLIPANALADLFKLFSDRVNCVLLNGCYTKVQAKVIAEHIPYVIGMKQSITDKAALDFALGFYDALGSGRSIEFAYHLGCSAIQMSGLPEHLTPILYKKTESDSSRLNPVIFDGKTRNISSKRHIQEKREDLEEEYQNIRKKLKFLKQEWNIKTDSEAKYELKQRIEQYEEQLQNIEGLLDE
ncbi:hypothetical protein GTQ43_15470 [Nostoc sp. KVJ3]|uniref:hypothetical protein n=1 Tax=Nostoc sp. KVJ3 TaxID=457945 RepID=UPI0022370A11|nr:hypothetical protein [Nostoc sp. KVJ3]MCW5315156.1 hypothetical protein [Nostoc sp. KVJ3]